LSAQVLLMHIATSAGARALCPTGVMLTGGWDAQAAKISGTAAIGKIFTIFTVAPSVMARLGNACRWRRPPGRRQIGKNCLPRIMGTANTVPAGARRAMRTCRSEMRNAPNGFTTGEGGLNDTADSSPLPRRESTERKVDRHFSHESVGAPSGIFYRESDHSQPHFHRNTGTPEHRKRDDSGGVFHRKRERSRWPMLSD